MTGYWGFGVVKTKDNDIDISRLLSSQTWILFIEKMQTVIENCQKCDDAVSKIAKIK
jgi:hypothetical protein